LFQVVLGKGEPLSIEYAKDLNVRPCVQDVSCGFSFIFRKFIEVIVNALYGCFTARGLQLVFGE